MQNYKEKVTNILTQYNKVKRDRKLLELGYTTLAEYLWFLKVACQSLSVLEENAILYLAAAVSDFYIPSSEMVRNAKLDATISKKNTSRQQVARLSWNH